MTLSLTAGAVAASHAEYLTYRVEDLAELVRSCGEDIHRELVAIEGRTDAPLEFAKGVTERVDTLVEVIRETAEQIRSDIEKATEGSATAPVASTAHPSAKHWRDYQTAIRAHNASPEDDAALAVAFSEAQDRFIYAEDATLQGIYFKLRLLEQSQKLTGYLDENPNLMWPRIILTILRDLKALGSLEEPNGDY